MRSVEREGGREKRKEKERKEKGEGERGTGVTGQDVWKGPAIF